VTTGYLLVVNVGWGWSALFVRQWFGVLHGLNRPPTNGGHQIDAFGRFPCKLIVIGSIDCVSRSRR
jgi:hypothetical protein